MQAQLSGDIVDDIFVVLAYVAAQTMGMAYTKAAKHYCFQNSLGTQQTRAKPSAGNH